MNVDNDIAWVRSDPREHRFNPEKSIKYEIHSRQTGWNDNKK